MGRSLDLTQRELHVARVAADGLTCREIAARLLVSENTVKTHLEHIYEKLGVRNRLEMEHRLPPPTEELLLAVTSLPFAPNVSACVANWLSFC